MVTYRFLRLQWAKDTAMSVTLNQLLERHETVVTMSALPDEVLILVKKFRPDTPFSD